jgi:hypothetical protein
VRTLQTIAVVSAFGVGVLYAGPVLTSADGVAAADETVTKIEPSFSVDRGGARTAATLKVQLQGGENGVPPPLKKAVLHVPAGLANEHLQWPTTLGCSGAHLRAHGARGCPPHSLIGSGSALLKWPEGGTTVGSEHARLWAFVGPTNGEYALEILGEGAKPVHRRVVMRVPLAAETGPYSAALEVLVPAIPAFPGERDASIAELNLTLGGTPSAGHRPSGLGIFVPRTCPEGGFPWEVDFTFTDGTSATAAATIPCP